MSLVATYTLQIVASDDSTVEEIERILETLDQLDPEAGLRAVGDRISEAAPWLRVEVIA